MKKGIISILLALMSTATFTSDLFAFKKKVAQSGMTYLAVSLGARESAMGDASVAAVRGIQGCFYNPAVLADIKGTEGCINQVNWLVDTKLYGMAAAQSLGNLGTIGFDLVYMDYGQIVGTKRVDKSVNDRGFITTGDINVQEFAVGVSYSRRISDKFAFGMKVKCIHEDLGKAAIVVKEITDDETGEIIKIREDKNWKLNHWGMDFGTIYHTGFKSLAFAMFMQNFSTDMKYWYEEFQLPMSLRLGMSMDMTDFFMEDNENLAVNFAIDAINPNDYTERIHIGTEVVCLKRFALRTGYKFNHDVESFTFGMGINFEIAGCSAVLDYGFTRANYFKDINRFSVHFSF
ncbi:PorV/PorQ family protein [candidate division KSB1 bacterium]|nr:PorV/PorQ family protein [candidate division KSB1 bacterium]MBL7092837.1 PorV/PorQ family protein [candidate division KSB1 bacterium]